MNNKDRYITDFLFATPNYLTGAGTVINLAGNYYAFNVSKTGEEADHRAIQNDFNMIGQDIFDVIEGMKSMDNKQILSK
jgi:hypothetical protein